MFQTSQDILSECLLFGIFYGDFATVSEYFPICQHRVLLTLSLFAIDVAQS